MRRFFVSLFVIVILLSVSRTSADAVTPEELMEQCGATEVLEEEEESENFGERLWDCVKNAFMGCADGVLGHAGMILGCVLLISAAESVSSIRESEALSSVFDFTSAAVLAAACFPALYSVFNYTRTAVDSLCAFGMALTPVMASLYALGGNPSQAVSASAGTTMFLNGAQLVSSKLLMPLLSLGFAFALLGLLPNSGNAAPVASFVKNCACVVLAFVFSLVCFVFYFQTTFAASADNMVYRSAKFASGSFIPVIGGAVGESTRTVFGAVSVVKTTVGSGGLLAMLGYLLPPLISATLYRMVFSLSSLAAKLCGCEKQGRFLGEIGSLVGISTAVLVACGVVFTVISAVFLKSGAAA